MDESSTLVRAARLLARRPLTEDELRRRLQDVGHAPEQIDAACERLRADGYLDDRALALDFIVTRSARLGHGPERLRQDLRRRGVDPEVVAAAWRSAIERGDVDPDAALRSQIRRRAGGAGRLDPRAYARVYNALRRAGFDEERVRQQLDPLRESADPHDVAAADETYDDFP